MLRTTLRELLCGIICLIKHRAIFKELSSMPAFVSELIKNFRELTNFCEIVAVMKHYRKVEVIKHDLRKFSTLAINQ